MKYLVWCKYSLNHSFISSAKNFEHPHSPLIVLRMEKGNPGKSSGCPVKTTPPPPTHTHTHTPHTHTHPPPQPSPSSDPIFEEVPWSLAAVLPSVGHDALATIHQQRRNNKVHYILFRVSPSSIIHSVSVKRRLRTADCRLRTRAKMQTVNWE